MTATKPMPHISKITGANSEWKPFTYGEYRALLQLAEQHYRFVSFDCAGEENKQERRVFWRHDIDLSVDRALELARIEHGEAVQSTFFVHLHSTFYHPWEKETTRILRKIADLGHWIGLHFDCTYYGTSEVSRLESALVEERVFLERLVGLPVTVFSLHNPTDDMLSRWTMEQVGGMANTYSACFRNHVDYVSDSNGIWRYRKLRDVLDRHEQQELQVLTHPGWWTEEVMSPENKIRSVIAGRAEATESIYRTEARVVIAEEPQQNEIIYP